MTSTLTILQSTGSRRFEGAAPHSKRTANILRSLWAERFYGDGPPTWFEGKNACLPQTAADAKQSRDLAVKHLMMSASSDRVRRHELETLAAVLEPCRAGNRCLSGGCPLCCRALQRWFVWTMPIVARRLGEQLVAFNIVLTLRMREGNSIDHMRRQLGRMYASLPSKLDGLGFAAAGIDISANENCSSLAHYQFQLYGFATEREWDFCDAGLRERFSQPGIVRTPVRKRRFDGNPVSLAYAFKPNFDRRLTIPAVNQEEAECAGTTVRRQNTKPRALRVHQDAELRLILNELGLDRRVFLLGADITVNRNGRPVIRKDVG
jgi:hypothetical protein